MPAGRRIARKALSCVRALCVSPDPRGSQCLPTSRARPETRTPNPFITRHAQTRLPASKSLSIPSCGKCAAGSALPAPVSRHRSQTAGRGVLVVRGRSPANPSGGSSNLLTCVSARYAPSADHRWVRHDHRARRDNTRQDEDLCRVPGAGPAGGGRATRAAQSPVGLSPWDAHRHHLFLGVAAARPSSRTRATTDEISPPRDPSPPRRRAKTRVGPWGERAFSQQ